MNDDLGTKVVKGIFLLLGLMFFSVGVYGIWDTLFNWGDGLGISLLCLLCSIGCIFYGAGEKIIPILKSVNAWVHQKIDEYTPEEVKQKRLQEEEEKEILNTKRVADLKGIEKRIKYIEDDLRAAKEEYNKLVAEASDKRNKMERTATYGHEKEKNWAVRGGVVATVVNPVAGAMVAADAQRKNVEIRQRNAQKTTPRYDIFLEMEVENLETWKIPHAKKTILNLENQIIEERKKMVREITLDEFKEYIDFTEENIEKSLSGGIRLSVNIANKGWSIGVHHKRTVIDGSISAKVMSGDKVLDEIFLVIPRNGMEYGINTTLSGISTKVQYKSNKYDIKYEPYNLFLIEA